MQSFLPYIHLIKPQKQKIMENYHIIKISPIIKSNGGRRVKLISEFYGSSKVINWDYSLSTSCEIGKKYLIDQGFEMVGTATGSDCKYSFFITSNFETIK